MTAASEPARLPLSVLIRTLDEGDRLSRTLRSVANLTRLDGSEFLALAHQIPVHAAVETLPLDQANVALSRLRAGDVQGALVLTIP